MGSQVFVAPHSDDVALSCGGSVAVAARTGSPSIVTVFSGTPHAPTSEFARFQHDRWGLSDGDVATSRRREDRCAADALGVSVRNAWMDFLDAIYRDEQYGSDDALFGEISAADMPIIDEITDALAKLDAGEYIVPLAVGNHVDHQIVRKAGQRLAELGATVWAYADMPYALANLSAIAGILRDVESELRLIPLDDDALARRWKAIGCYPSQLPVIFRNIQDPRLELEQFAMQAGCGQCADVLWRIYPHADITSCTKRMGTRYSTW